MHVQIVEFEVRGIGRDEYARRCEQIASAFAALPGLVAKAWIVDPESNRAGGVHTWADGRLIETLRGVGYRWRGG